MTKKWAQDCAKLEKAASGSIFKATLVYEAKWNEDWSAEGIAGEVRQAGGLISEATVRRRLVALGVARRDPRPNLEAAFAQAYAEENRATRGGFGQTPLDLETRVRVYLEGVVGEFERLFSSDELPDLDEDEMLTRREVAKLARVSYNGVRGWERQGRLTPVRVMHGGVEEVRIPRSEVEAIIRERVEEVAGIQAPAPEVENKMLREALARSEADRDMLQERYDKILERLLEVTQPGK